jgi:aspartyl-tRNA(Asn)/glutamyl-tRNA(Gln) amidotransferase subunit A
MTIKEAQEKLRSGGCASKDLVNQCLETAKKRDETLKAFLEIFDDAVSQAEAIDAKYGPTKYAGAPEMAGIPIALKDNILVEGKIASSGSKILENYRAVYDATVVRKLKEVGAVIIGRTNMDEFAMGSSTENSAYQLTKNPYDENRVPGGSSGGSAASVASGMALAALGSDTGGSVRQPASFCGVVGMKPTYGAVSRYGVMAMASSLDQIGPFAQTVEDAEIIYKTISGFDKMDSTSLEAKSYKPKAGAKRLGVPRAFLEKGLEKDVLENFEKSVEALKGVGYEIKDVSLPNIGYSLAVYYVIMPAEVSSNLARFDGVKYGLHVEGDSLLGDYMKTRGQGFGKEPRRRIILGTYVLSAGYYDAYYGKAKAVRELIRTDFRNVFKDVDAIITPTTPSPAFKIGEKVNDPLAMYLEDIFTVPANIAGVPAMSVPSGFVEREGKKLPLGLQITAPWLEEEMLFAIGKDFEKARK